MKKFLFLTAVLLAGVSGNSLMQAQVISVQYTTAANPSGVDGDGIATNGYTAGVVPETVWNTDATTTSGFSSVPLYNTGLSDLMSSTGSTTISERASVNGTDNPPANTGFTNPGDASLFSNGAYAGYGSISNTLDLSLSGVNSTATYDLILYVSSASGNQGAVNLTALLNGQTFNFTPTSNAQGSFAQAAPFPGDSTANYVEFTNVSGSVLNSYATSITGSNESGFIFNGFQLVTVSTPEPSTVGLLAFGVAGLVLLAYRKKAKA